MFDIHVRSACGTKSKCFKCDICGSQFKTKQNITNHVNAVHNGLKPYICPICPLIFAYQTHVRQHVKEVHDKIKCFNCGNCGK